MAKAKKLPSGNWRCKANYKNEQGDYVNKSFTAETRKEAEFAAAQFLVDLKHKKKPANKTIGEMVTEYIDNRTSTLSPSTVVGYRRIQRTAFTDIMRTRAGLVTQKAYEAAVNEYAATRKPKTVREAHRLLMRVFEANGVDIDESQLTLPRKVKTEIKIPTTEQVKAIAELAKDKGIYLQVLFAALLGMRKSEIFALTWADIDIDKREVFINKSMVKDEYGGYIVKNPKTYESTRRLPLPQQIIDALPERGAENAPLFSMTFPSFQRRYRTITDKLELNGYTFHTLRHYNASVMLKQGIPDKYAAERMGHSTVNMLKQVYQHTFEDAHRGFDSKMTEHFDSVGF